MSSHNAYGSLFARLVANSVESDEYRFRGRPCRCWHGPMSGSYGRINVWENGRTLTRQVHRVMAELALGFKLDPEITIQHACDIPWCIDWFHFDVATRVENTQDMQNKRRRLPRKVFKPLIDPQLYDYDVFEFALPVLRTTEAAECPF